MGKNISKDYTPQQCELLDKYMPKIETAIEDQSAMFKLITNEIRRNLS